MSNPYIGEIRMFAGNFPPVGWSFCDGSLLPIAEYSAVFNLIGTTYGGDGQSTFALPDMRGRLPLHQGTGFPIGQSGGVENVTLSATQIPAHSHVLNVSQVAASQTAPASNLPAAASSVALFNGNSPNKTLAASAVALAGSSEPHDNLQPYVCVSFIIALDGIYPSQS
jgi:microcystin-dependent protein